MRHEFEGRLGRPCLVVGNSVDPNDFVPIPQSVSVQTGVLRYVGGLHLGRDRIVSIVADALSRTPATRSWRVELFVPEVDRTRAQRLDDTCANVSYGGSLEPRSVPAALMASSALLFMESDQVDLARFTRLSISTKVPQYLASGRPILVLGPSDQGSVGALLKTSSSIYGGTPRTSEALKGALIQLADLAESASHDVVNEAWFRSEFGDVATRARLLEGLQFAVSRAHAQEYTVG